MDSDEDELDFLRIDCDFELRAKMRVEHKENIKKNLSKNYDRLYYLEKFPKID